MASPIRFGVFPADAFFAGEIKFGRHLIDWLLHRRSHVFQYTSSWVPIFTKIALLSFSKKKMIRRSCSTVKLQRLASLPESLCVRSCLSNGLFLKRESFERYRFFRCIDRK